MHQVKVMDLPYGKFRDKGQPIDNISNYDSTQEEIVYICDSEQMRYANLLFATKQGMVKKVGGSEFQVTKRTIAATRTSILYCRRQMDFSCVFRQQKLRRRRKARSECGVSAWKKTMHWRMYICLKRELSVRFHTMKKKSPWTVWSLQNEMVQEQSTEGKRYDTEHWTTCI